HLEARAGEQCRLSRSVRTWRERGRVSRTGLVRPCDRRGHPRDHRQAPGRWRGRRALAHAGPAAPRHATHVREAAHGEDEVKRAAIATLVVSIATTATADTAKQPPPDEIADIESREANLEPDEPRSGIT